MSLIRRSEKLMWSEKAVLRLHCDNKSQKARTGDLIINSNNVAIFSVIVQCLFPGVTGGGYRSTFGIPCTYPR